MAGTVSGGKKAAKKNKEKYGDNFYKEIGSKGGKLGTTGGFWHKKYVLGDVESIRKAGAKGGRATRRDR